jgi:hypothetical protein
MWLLLVQSDQEFNKINFIRVKGTPSMDCNINFHIMAFFLNGRSDRKSAHNNVRAFFSLFVVVVVVPSHSSTQQLKQQGRCDSLVMHFCSWDLQQ